MFGAGRVGLGIHKTGSSRMKEGEQLVMGLHGTHWNPVLPQGNWVQ